MSTWRLKAIKDVKIKPHKGDNRVLCMFGHKFISHLIAFEHQKKGDRQYQNILILAKADRRALTYSRAAENFFY